MHPFLASRRTALAAILSLTATLQLIPPAHGADLGFTDQLTVEERASAGLDKLTPAERARLDALIRQHETGELTRIRERATQAEAARLAAERQAAAAQADAAQQAAAARRATAQASAQETAAATPKAARSGWLDKIRLKPGTEIEYETLETELIGDFKGWSVNTVFVLANGQRWKAISGSYVTPKVPGPLKVKVVPGMLGSFFLEIEGIRQRPKVVFVPPTQ